MRKRSRAELSGKAKKGVSGEGRGEFMHKT
jgi:hypothetical protein